MEGEGGGESLQSYLKCNLSMKQGLNNLSLFMSLKDVELLRKGGGNSINLLSDTQIGVLYDLDFKFRICVEPYSRNDKCGVGHVVAVQA